MKFRPIYVLALFFISFGNTALTSLETPPGVQSELHELQLASSLCKAIQDNSKFTKEQLSDSLLQKLKIAGVPESAFVAKIASEMNQLFASKGACRSVERIGAVFSQEINQYLFHFKDSSPYGLLIHADSKTEFGALAFFAEQPSAEALSMDAEKVKMRDGIKLLTHIYRNPKSLGPQPVVLVRTPYFNSYENYFAVQHSPTANYFVKQGYVVVLQSMRGMHGSEGIPKYFNPKEPEDAYDTIEWIAEQDFSNGKVATIGTSYEGYGAITAGILNPPALKVIIAGSGPTDPSNGVFSYQGITSLQQLEYLHYLETGKGGPYGKLFGSEALKPNLKKIERNLNTKQYDELYYGYPVQEWKLFAEALSDMDHPYWQKRQHLTSLHMINIPTFQIAGTLGDGDLVDTVYNYFSLQKKSKDPSQHHLILGHWGHGNNTPYMDGSNVSPFLGQTIADILNHHLKDNQTESTWPRVLLSPNNGTIRFTGDEFPPKDFSKLRLYFADSSEGDAFSGELSNKPKYQKASSSYENRPLDKETLGQELSFLYTNNSSKPVILMGPIKIDAYFEIDVPRSNALIGFTKETAQGESVEFSTCLTGVDLREGLNHFTNEFCSLNEVLQPNETLVVTLTSNLFAFGNPMTRHPNVSPEDFFTKSQDAEIRILHSKSLPSSVTLTLAPERPDH